MITSRKIYILLGATAAVFLLNHSPVVKKPLFLTAKPGHEKLVLLSQTLARRIDENPEEVGSLAPADFKYLSETVSPLELQKIKEMVLSTQTNNIKRQASLFLLSKLGPIASDSLTEVAKSQIPIYKNSKNPHSVDSLQTTFELSLRVTAIEALDDLVVENSTIEKNIRLIEQTQTNLRLKYLAQLSLSGIQSNRPGKVRRLIDAMLAERSKS